MKLSTAIHLGALCRPQAFSQFLAVDGSGSCALGAAFEAVYCGDALYAKCNIWRIGALWPWSVNSNIPNKVRCPACDVCSATIAASVVVHLNDDHRWTREQIAEWVATIEPADVNDHVAPLPTPETVQV